MSRAIELARGHHTHPNPRVGAVIVSTEGSVLGEGAHHAPGEDHAEVVALKASNADVTGATMYVSLEPCSHHGRTPPCVEAIIEAGIGTVVTGASDPDTRVSGTGVARLRDAGIDVVEDVMIEESRAVDPAYFHHRETGMPLVTVKYAMTLDGSAAAADRTSQWITSDEARLDVHRLRAESDAVVVGSGTLKLDDPRLDVRLSDYVGPQPSPVIIAGQMPMPSLARIWERQPVIVATQNVEIPSGEVVVVEGEAGRPDPAAACRALADKGLLQLLLEGGPTLVGSWMKAGVVARGVVYVGGKLGGGQGMGPVGGVFETIETARVVSITSTRSLGPDIRIDFEI